MTQADPEGKIREQAEALCAQLVPQLEQHMAVYTGLNEQLLGPDQELGADQLEAHGAESERVLALGWALGVLSTAAGLDTLLERRERRGLSHMARALGLSLVQQDAASTGQTGLPNLSVVGDHSWQASFLFAWLCGHAGATSGSPMRWRLERNSASVRLYLELGRGGARARLGLGGACAWIEPSAVVGELDRGVLELPQAWIEPAPRSS